MSTMSAPDTPPFGRRPTMRDVAERCGVSIKTVSRVVNGQPGTSSETTDRILAAIADLGFQRNQLASDLRHRGPSSMIGVVIEDVSNPFYGSMIRAVEEEAHSRGIMVLSVSSDEDPDRELELVRGLVARQVAGLIVVSARSDNTYLEPDIRRGIPVVFADRPGSGLECDEILLDNVAGSREAVEHLVRQGHTRIGVIADHDHVFTAHERVRGYRQALDAHGLTLRPEYERIGRHTTEQAADAVHELLALPDPPTAVFTTNNRSTAGALRAIYSRDAQIGIVGFDDFEFADLLKPAVTVVWHDAAQVGHLAARRLFQRLEGDGSPAERLTVPSRLVVRASGALRTAAEWAAT